MFREDSVLERTRNKFYYTLYWEIRRYISLSSSKSSRFSFSRRSLLTRGDWTVAKMPPVKLIVAWHEFLSKWEYQFVGAKQRDGERTFPGARREKVARPGWKPEGGEEEEEEKEEAGG